ncbi:MAG: phenylalanine--tRNA ligase subunit beta [Oligoflexia bacterium]|nr:phenylalanine--tRNA ligase subunit beta [Oligoflexia bacterium]
MKVSLSWLRDYIDLPNDVRPEEVASKLTFSGFEVESVEVQGAGLEQVVIGQIIEKEKHPNADRLSVTKIDIGEETKLNIVCGASNIKVGQKIPVALIGATIPNGLTLKPTKIRSVASEGMLCSLDELLLPKEWQSEDGIFILPETVKVGQKFKDYLGYSDTILDISVTPNRGDALSVMGIAREVAALYSLPVKAKEEKPSLKGKKSQFKIENLVGEEFCPQYLGCEIRGVKIAESPDWLKTRLEAVGLRSINNIVDCTAYIMWDMGQPMHAFDLDKLSSSKVKIRYAQDKENFETLANKKVELESTDLVIADEKKAIALAGVIGGANSEVSDQTKNIFLECAEFSAVSVRKTGRRIATLTDAGYRFERGIDPNRVGIALDRAIEMIISLAGGEAFEKVGFSKNFERESMRLPMSDVAKLLGRGPDIHRATQILRSLGFSAEVAAGEPEVIKVQVPSWRKDISRPTDLIEELVRVWGFENLESKVPVGGVAADEPEISKRRSYFQTRRIRRHLASLGFNECLNYAFTSYDELTKVLAKDELSKLVKILNPVSEDYAVMKPNLLSGLLHNAKYNMAHRQKDLRLFEIRKVFEQSEKRADPKLDTGTKESFVLAILWSGAENDEVWDGKAKQADFYSLKGVLDSIFAMLGQKGVQYQASNLAHSYFHPGQAALLSIGKKSIGGIGRIHPIVKMRFEFESNVYYCEIDLDSILTDKAKIARFKEFSKFPRVERDFSVLVSDTIQADELKSFVLQEAKPFIQELVFFDVYKGERVPAGHTSYAFRIFLSSQENTLADKEIQEIQDKVMKGLSSKYNAKFAGLT